jgi:hypothetical protein
MSEAVRRRARLLAYSWFRTTCLEASHQAAWQFCRNHWTAFLGQALPEQQRPSWSARPEDAPVRLVC